MIPRPPRHLNTPPRFLLGYGLLILASSLYPFSNWAMPSGNPLEFLTAAWPRYITRTDLATNLLSYTPLGYALAREFSLPGRPLRGVILGLLAGALLSFVCETGQNFLPSRIASNLDLLVNGLGVLLGALLAIHHQRWLRAVRALMEWRSRWLKPGLRANVGLVLLALWLLTQFALVPLSGIGWLPLHLRPLDSPPDGLSSINSTWLMALSLELVALGGLTSCLLRPGRYVGGLALLLLLAFITKLMVATVLLKLTVVGGVLSLETLTAFVLALWVLLLPAVSRHRDLVTLIAMGGLVTVRMLLANSYFPDVSALNVVGLAKYLGTLWPLLGICWLLLGIRRQNWSPAT